MLSQNNLAAPLRNQSCSKKCYQEWGSHLMFSHLFIDFFFFKLAHILPDVLKFLAANSICLQIFGTASRKMIKWSSSPWSLNFEIAWLALSPTVLGQDFLPRVSFSSYSLFSLAELLICRMSVNSGFFYVSDCLPLNACQHKKRENIQPSKGRREFQVCNKKMSSKVYFFFS